MLAGISPAESPWPYELAASLVEEHQDRDYISVSAIVGGCMRARVLERKEEYVSSLDERYAIIRGTQVHKTLEHNARPGSLAEARFSLMLDDYKLSCSPDLITADSLIDWKVTNSKAIWFMYYPFRHHTEQLQANRFIFNNAESWQLPEGGELPIPPREWRIRHLAIVYLGPDGVKTMEYKTKQPHTTPNGRETTKLKPNVWDDDVVVDMLRRKVANFQRALDSYPKWPEGLEEQEDWLGPADWRCPGPPLCELPNCLAKRYPDSLVWDWRK